MKRKKGHYSISAVAKMFSVHQQTVRLYEKEGLITPKRSEGNTRLFSEEDVDKLEQVIYLTHELGINLAGVEMALKLQRQIKKLQKEINNIFEASKKQLDEESNSYKEQAKKSAQQLMIRKQKALKKADTESNFEQLPIEIEDWEINYEE